MLPSIKNEKQKRLDSLRADDRQKLKRVAE